MGTGRYARITVCTHRSDNGTPCEVGKPERSYPTENPPQRCARWKARIGWLEVCKRRSEHGQGAEHY